MANEKILPIVLKFVLDRNSLQQVKDGILPIEKAFDRVAENLETDRHLLVDISQGLKTWSRELDVISRRSLIGGGAILGGLFAGANNFIRNQKEGNQLTRDWATQTDRVAKAQERLWAVVAREGLPALRQAATLAERIASFVEKNPGAVRLAINTGTALLAIAGLAKGLSVLAAGVKLVADARLAAIALQQFLAGKLMVEAANKQLIAANISNSATDLRRGLGIDQPAVPFLGVVGIGLGINVAVAKLLNQVEASLSQMIGSSKAAKLITNALSLFFPGAYAIRLAEEGIEKIKKLFGDFGQATSSPVGSGNVLGPHQDQIVQAYTQMLEEEKEAIARYAEDRQRIINEAGQREVAAARQNASAIASINANFTRQISSLVSSFRSADRQALQNYNRERAEIVRDGGLEIERLEADHQERMRDLLFDHEEKVADLIGERDAVGLFREMQRFERERREEERNLSIEIARRRQDLAVRLNDLAANFAAERAQRLENFQQQLAQAREQHALQLKEQQARYRDELRQIREAKSQQLNELDRAHREEQLRRRQAFLAQVRDLDASLLGEQNLRRRYYQAMLNDVNSFLSQYRSQSTGVGGARGSAGSRHSGGYVGDGNYNLKMGEFVLKDTTARAMERMVGGRLTQDNVMGGGFVWNDYRSFNEDLSAEMMAKIEAQTARMLEYGMQLKGANR